MLAVAQELIAAGGLTGLFVGSFLASTLLPGGSEAMLLLAVETLPRSPWQLWLIASLGNTLGGLSGWLLGHWLARRFPHRALQRPEHRRALQRLGRYSEAALLFSWLPVIGDPLCVAAGWSGSRLLPATLYIGCGKACRYGALLWLFSG